MFTTCTCIYQKGNVMVDGMSFIKKNGFLQYYIEYYA